MFLKSFSFDFVLATERVKLLDYDLIILAICVFFFFGFFYIFSKLDLWMIQLLFHAVTCLFPNQVDHCIICAWLTC